MASTNSDAPLRFVVLYHQMPPRDGRGNHWDFMLEEHDALTAWALDAVPELSEKSIPCVQLPPHRKHYLDYEGPVSNDRGTVKRYDIGTFEWIERSESKVVVRINGERLTGEIEITRDLGSDHAWVFRIKGTSSAETSGS